jgi:glutathione S-transferase
VVSTRQAKSENGLSKYTVNNIIKIIYRNLADGDFQISESLAIMQYISEKSQNLSATVNTAQDRATVSQAALVVHDFRIPIRNFTLATETKQSSLEKASVFLKKFQSALASKFTF